MPRTRTGKKCTLPWCLNQSAGGNWCAAHWSAVHKYGTPTPAEHAHSGKASWHRIRLIARTCTHCGELKMADTEYSNNGKGFSWCKRCTTRAANKSKSRHYDPVKASAAAKKFYNEVQTTTLQRADNWGTQWTTEQEHIAMDPDLTMTEKALKLGRSYKAIDSRIYIIKNR